MNHDGIADFGASQHASWKRRFCGIDHERGGNMRFSVNFYLFWGI